MDGFVGAIRDVGSNKKERDGEGEREEDEEEDEDEEVSRGVRGERGSPSLADDGRIK